MFQSKLLDKKEVVNSTTFYHDAEENIIIVSIVQNFFSGNKSTKIKQLLLWKEN